MNMGCFCSCMLNRNADVFGSYFLQNKQKDSQQTDSRNQVNKRLTSVTDDVIKFTTLTVSELSPKKISTVFIFIIIIGLS